MAKGENIEKPKKKTGLVLIIATGAKPKKDSVKKAEEPRKPRKRGRGRSRAQKEHFRQNMENNPFHLDDTLLRMNLPKEYFEGYLKNKHNMSIKDALANEDLNIPQLLSEAKDFHLDMDNLHPNTLDLLQRRGINLSDFQRDFKENPYMDFKERVNTLAQRGADDRGSAKRKKAAAKQFKDGTIASGLKSKRLAELLERKGISVRQFYDSFMDKDTPLDLPFKERINRLADNAGKPKPKPKNFHLPDFETQLPDYYIPPSAQEDIDRDAEEEAHEQDMFEREMNLLYEDEKGQIGSVYSQDEAEGIDERLLRFYLNLYSHHRNPMKEAMKAIRVLQSGGGLKTGQQLHSGKPEFPTLFDTDKQSDMFAHYKTGGPVHLQPSTEFTEPYQESSVATPDESESDARLRELREFESYRRSEDETSPIDAAMALLKGNS